MKIEHMTDETIAPFGEIIATRESVRPPDFQGIATDVWYTDYAAEKTSLLVAVHTHYRPLRFSRLERHLKVTQAFIPVGGAPSVVALAPAPTVIDDWNDLPQPDQVRAFLIDGNSYMLKRGTWHSLDRFPLDERGSQFIILTEKETQDEFDAVPKPEWRRTQDVDFAEEHGTTFELSL